MVVGRIVGHGGTYKILNRIYKNIYLDSGSLNCRDSAFPKYGSTFCHVLVEIFILFYFEGFILSQTDRIRDINWILFYFLGGRNVRWI